MVGGIVRRVENYGVFVNISGCRTAGLVHISEVSDSKEKIKDLAALFRKGQAVKAKVRGQGRGRGAAESSFGGGAQCGLAHLWNIAIKGKVKEVLVLFRKGLVVRAKVRGQGSGKGGGPAEGAWTV